MTKHLEDKRKFFVVINAKYLLIVESTSLGGAEHVILDQFHTVIQGVQAYELTQSKYLFDMYPEVETTNFQFILKIDKLAYAQELRTKAKQMLEEADSIIDTYSK